MWAPIQQNIFPRDRGTSGPQKYEVRVVPVRSFVARRVVSDTPDFIFQPSIGGPVQPGREDQKKKRSYLPASRSPGVDTRPPHHDHQTPFFLATPPKSREDCIEYVRACSNLPHYLSKPQNMSTMSDAGLDMCSKKGGSCHQGHESGCACLHLHPSRFEEPFILVIRSCAKTQWYFQTSQPPASPSQFPRPRFHAHPGSSYWH